MIESGDMARPARVMVQDGERREWLRPWRKRPTWRIVFVGFIQGMQYDMRRGTRLEMVDAVTRLRYKEHEFMGVAGS